MIESGKILVTAAAGFIDAALSKRLLDEGNPVIGVDNLNDYYDVSLKEARLRQLMGYENFRFARLDIARHDEISRLFAAEKPDRVVNLAAQAGVRYSLSNPHVYIDANLVGFLNIPEGCGHWNVAHLVYASSSSVYGANTCLPFSTRHHVDHPISLYAATKKSNELMAHCYSHESRPSDRYRYGERTCRGAATGAVPSADFDRNTYSRNQPGNGETHLTP
uniref:GDP-mannose 4,6 dehydratase n=1 Tax=Candidatus Kentrum sp. SD TaxID=2126332 RepID=A0A450YUS1_9GAMM|nr:MAG: GDP-mannose 4,6 dehydratase [Candidatus Kentron sp. SD]VFK49691.1 MAG: GDP-mannose 4,6 dehydratase [Candidatus Kentron sp. SD]